MSILDEDNFGSNTLSESTTRQIGSAVGWIKFVAIFNIVINALGVLSNLSKGASGITSAGFTILSIYIYVLLLQSGNFYGNFVNTRSSIDLEKAIEKQKQYWSIATVLFIIVVVLIVLGAIVLFLFAGQLRNILR